MHLCVPQQDRRRYLYFRICRLLSRQRYGELYTTMYFECYLRRIFGLIVSKYIHNRLKTARNSYKRIPIIIMHRYKSNKIRDIKQERVKICDDFSIRPILCVLEEFNSRNARSGNCYGN